MRDEFKFLSLVPLFAAVGGFATVAAWHLYAVLFFEVIPNQLTVLACLVAGLAGPAIVLSVVLVATRAGKSATTWAVRRSASVGLGLVLAAELGFYIPLGFFAIAFA
jgi:hypothetical protein